MHALSASTLLISLAALSAAVAQSAEEYIGPRNSFAAKCVHFPASP